MERAAAAWRYSELHSERPFHDGTFPENPNAWAQHRTTETPYHYQDGVNVWVSNYDLSPDDKFLGAGEPEDADDGDWAATRGND